MYRDQDLKLGILNLVSNTMFNINKIRAHLKMLEFQQLKLTRYLAETEASSIPTKEAKIQDIQRCLKRVNEGIDLWQGKLAAIEAAPPRAESRPALTDGPDRPLIG
jgi:hypothetical protein